MKPELNRRDFVKSVALAGAGLLTAGPLQTSAGRATAAAFQNQPWRGVNLGGWLALEKWISPSVYAGVDAPDEYTLCHKLGKQAAEQRLKRHRETWITADDFRWIAELGLNAVRLPVTYGVLEENPPFITGRETLEWAFRMANESGLGVLLDLHGVPGSQNSWDHSGRAGILEWHTSRDNIADSLRILEELAAFCSSQPNLVGLELVNEPGKGVPLEFLRSFYGDAYQRVRKHLPAERAAIFFHDSFRIAEWADVLQEPDYRNVVLDTHLYQCFGEDDHRRDIHGQVELAALGRKKELDQVRRKHRCIVGEWSCGVPSSSLPKQSGLEFETAMRAFGSAQLVTYNTTEGWFFWTYRTEKDGGWNFRHCVERGWLPERYGPATSARQS